METTIRYIFCVAAVVLAAVSCQKFIEPANPAEEGKGTIDIRIGGLMGEYTQVDAVKSELVNTVRVSWKGGETVYVYDGTQCLGSLAASLEGDEDRYALLSTDDTHTVATPSKGTSRLTLVHSPLLTEAPSVSNGTISISLDGQREEKAPFVAYATLDYTGAETVTDAVVPFKFATSVIKVNCTGLKANTAIDYATLSNVNTACKITLSGTEVPTVNGDVNGIIIKTGDSYFVAGKVNGEGEAVFQIAVPVLGAVSGTRVLTVVQGSDKFKDMKLTTGSLNPAKSVNTVCQLVALPAGVLSGEFSVRNGNSQPVRQIHFSQGNLYCNRESKDSDDWKWHFYDKQYEYYEKPPISDKIIAQSDDMEIGLFTWGYSKETSLLPIGKEYVTGHTTAGNYQLVYDKPSSQGGDDWGVAYCESNGMTVGFWRTLTTKEWTYLLNTREVGGGTGEGKSYQRATINSDVNSGVYGVILYPDNYSAQTGATSYTGDEWAAMETLGCVFLPAAGHRNGAQVSEVDSNGYYWSSSAYDGGGSYHETQAYDVYFESTRLLPDLNEGRDFGRSVRLVTDVE